jgi:dTDP-glucose 4,6-dehydratase
VRVAVTGVAGYVGGWLRTALLSRGHHVYGQDRVSVPRHTHLVFDLADHGMRHDWLTDTRPDVVVHLAALYGRVWGETNLISTAAANAGITAELARDCDRAGIPLMYVSSSEVYGRTALAGTVTETSPLAPLNMYGLSKKWGEEACRVYAPDGLVIARLNMPYGPPKDQPAIGQRPHTSGIPGTVGYNVLHSMVWEAEHGLPLRVHQGTERCLTWVGDTMRGLVMILESGQPGIWNVCRNDDHRTVLDLARLVLDVTGSASELIAEPAPWQVTPRKSLDSTRLAVLGWTPEIELDEGVKRCWDYYRRFDADGTWRG